jgi:hypothetical protein
MSSYLLQSLPQLVKDGEYIVDIDLSYASSVWSSRCPLANELTIETMDEDRSTCHWPEEEGVLAHILPLLGDLLLLHAMCDFATCVCSFCCESMRKVLH